MNYLVTNLSDQTLTFVRFDDCTDDLSMAFTMDHYHGYIAVSKAKAILAQQSAYCPRDSAPQPQMKLVEATCLSTCCHCLNLYP